MKIHEYNQGSNEWLKLRATAFCASEASAMMGVSSYMTRSQLLDLKKSGNPQPVSEFQQRLFDRGHETEELARKIIEAQIADDLYPLTVSETVNGVFLLASLDGITNDGKTIFEHKLWNLELAASVSSGIVPDSHKWQLVQQLIVSGVEKVVFVVSDGTEDNMVKCDFYLNDDDKTALIDGWKQFDIDLQSHVITQIINLPAVTLDISEVALNLHTPEKLVDKIRVQAANVGVFDMSNEKGRDACRSHAATIIKCINPALAESKALASSAKKVISDDLNFRKQFEAGVREIAATHRAPLDEYEQVQKDIADKKARDERIEAERIENERLFSLLWDKAHLMNDRFDIDKEKAEIAKAKQAEQDEKDRLSREAELIEQGRLAAEKVNKEALEKAEREKLEAEQREKQAIEDTAKQARLDAFNVFKAKCEALNDPMHSVEYLQSQAAKLATFTAPDDEHQWKAQDLRGVTLDALNGVLIPAAKQRAIDLTEKLKAEAEKKRLADEQANTAKVPAKAIPTTIVPQAHNPVTPEYKQVAIEQIEVAAVTADSTTAQQCEKVVNENIIAMYATMNPVLHAKVVEAAGKVLEFNNTPQGSRSSFLHNLFDADKQGKALRAAFCLIIK